LIELKNGVTISTIMHALNSLYTKTYNARYGKRGHLFQERFRAVVADKKTYLRELTAHIHSNAKRIGLVKESAEYVYSSYPLYLGRANGTLDMGQEISEVLSEFAGMGGIEAYQHYVENYEKKKATSLNLLLTRKSIIGPVEFVTMIRDKMRAASNEKIASVKRTGGKVLQYTALLAGFMIVVGVAYGFHQFSVMAPKKAQVQEVPQAPQTVLAQQIIKPQLAVQLKPVPTF